MLLDVILLFSCFWVWENVCRSLCGCVCVFISYHWGGGLWGVLHHAARSVTEWKARLRDTFYYYYYDDNDGTCNNKNNTYNVEDDDNDDKNNINDNIRYALLSVLCLHWRSALFFYAFVCHNNGNVNDLMWWYDDDDGCITTKGRIVVYRDFRLKKTWTLVFHLFFIIHFKNYQFPTPNCIFTNVSTISYFPMSQINCICRLSTQKFSKLENFFKVDTKRILHHKRKQFSFCLSAQFPFPVDFWHYQLFVKWNFFFSFAFLFQ